MIRLFRVFIPTSIVGLLISEIILVMGCFLLAMAWQFQPFSFYLLYENGLAQASIALATIILGLYLNDCYERVRIRSWMVFVQQLCLILGIAFLVQALLSYAKMDIRMPRTSMLAGSVLCLFLLPGWRSVYSRIALEVFGAEKLIFAGTHPLQFELAQYLTDHPEFAMKPVGFAVEDEEARLQVKDYPVAGTIAELPALAAQLRFDRVILGLKEDESPQAIQAVIQLQQSGRNVVKVGDTYESVFGRVPISQLKPIQIMFKEGFSSSVIVTTSQVVYSWIIALTGVLLVSPIMLLTAIAVRLTSPGPVLFRQVRAGKNNVPFVLYKFRSMFADAEAHTGAVWAQENDPRITPLGRVLRKYRLDELPQLFNVLLGDMCMVGPRPERPEFIKVLAERVPFYMQRLSVHPGITGWAQINYRYGNTIEDTVTKLEYDLFYIKNLSPQLDFYIMFHTMKTMLLTRGAY
ncbi:MAG TPA: sugar transferase [Bryobacteraceae bacterium]|nr:sugar transferase [Bryobacteraceae bacterium]